MGKDSFYEDFDFRPLLKDKDEDGIKTQLKLMSAAYARGYIKFDQVREEICSDRPYLDDAVDLEALGEAKKIYFVYKRRGGGGAISPEDYAQQLTIEDREEYRPNVIIYYGIFRQYALRPRQADKFHEAYWLGVRTFLKTNLSDCVVASDNNELHPGMDQEYYDRALPSKLDHWIVFYLGSVRLELRFDFSPQAFKELRPAMAYEAAKEMLKAFKSCTRHLVAQIQAAEHLADDIIAGSQQRTLLEWLTSSEVITDEKQRANVEARVEKYRQDGFEDEQIIEFFSKRNPDYVKRAEQLKAQAEAEAAQEGDGTDTGEGKDSATGTDQSKPDEPIPVSGDKDEANKVKATLDKLQKYDRSFWIAKLMGTEGFDVNWFNGQPQQMNVVEIVNLFVEHNVPVPEWLNDMMSKAFASVDTDEPSDAAHDGTPS